MRTHTHEDPWVLPSEQHDHPLREIVPEGRMHGRREGTFLVLVAMFLVATITLPVLGASGVIDLSRALARLLPDLQLPVHMELALGVLAFPLGFVAIDLIVELYSRRRATAVIWVGLLVTIGLVALMRVSDAVAGGGAAFGPAIAFGACFLVAHLSNVFVFDAMRQRMGGRGLALRSILTTLIAQLVGWVAFTFVLYGYQTQIVGQTGPAVTTPITALAVGGFAYGAVCALVLVVPVVLAVRALAVYLRVGRFRVEEDDDFRMPVFANSEPRLMRPSAPPPPAPAARAEGSAPRTSPAPTRKLDSQRRPKPQAVIVDDAISSSPDLPHVAATPPPPPPRRDAKTPVPRDGNRSSIQPFNSAEMRFFTEGDHLEPADSSPDLSADAKRAQA